MKIVQNAAHIRCQNANSLLMLAYRTVNPHTPQDPAARCRFDMYVRISPGIPSPFRDQQRNWCYRGDKYTQDPPRMLRNLLNLMKKKIQGFDRVILYDNANPPETREVVRIIDGVIEINRIGTYRMMLGNYDLPDVLK